MKKQGEASLRIRLAGIAILGLFIALAAAAYFSGWQVERDSELITRDAIPGTITAHNMRMAMSRSVGWVMVAASAQTKETQDESFAIVDAADVAFNKAVSQYEATIAINPKMDRELLNRVKSRYAEFLRQRKAYEALLRAGDRDGSAAFLGRDLVPAYVPAIKAAEELLNYNHANSVGFAKDIRASVYRLYWAVAVVMVLALICAAVLVVSFATRRREIMRLRESEARIRILGDNLPSGMMYQLDMGADGRERRFTYVSAGVEKLHEVTAEAVMRDAQVLYGQIAEADRPLVAEREADALANMKPFTVELRMQLPSGGVRWSLLASAPRRTANGHVLWDGIELDITEQKLAQEEIRATNERYSRQEAALMELTRAYALRRASIADLKRKVSEIAAQTLKVERVGIWLYERDHQGIACQELFEQSKQSHSGGTVLRAGDNPAYFRALAEGDIIAAHDAYRDPRTTELSEIYLRPHGISSILDAPIHVIGSVTGVVCCEQVGLARQWTGDE